MCGGRHSFPWKVLVVWKSFSSLYLTLYCLIWQFNCNVSRTKLVIRNLTLLFKLFFHSCRINKENRPTSPPSLDHWRTGTGDARKIEHCSKKKKSFQVYKYSQSFPALLLLKKSYWVRIVLWYARKWDLGISNNQHFPQIVIENVKMISRTIAKPQTFAEKQVASLLKIWNLFGLEPFKMLNPLSSFKLWQVRLMHFPVHTPVAKLKMGKLW